MKKLLLVLSVVFIPVSSHATCVGAAPGTCGQQAIDQALQSSQARKQQMWDIINNANTTTQDRVQQNQQYWMNQANQQAQQNRQMLQNILNQGQQQRQWDEYTHLQRQQLEEQRRHNSYTEMQQDSAQSWMQQQARDEWERRQQPCTAYHHEGYLGGPEQPDAITVFDRNC